MTKEELLKELKNCRNELCLRCGKYYEAHKGACDDCRYNFEHMKKWEEADNVKPCSSCAHFNNGNLKPYPCGSCFTNTHNMWEAENEKMYRTPMDSRK